MGKLPVGERDNGIFYSPSYSNVTWNKIDGKLKQIAYDGIYLCGTDSNDDIFCSMFLAGSNPKWDKLDGKLKAISFASGLYILGVNSINAIFQGRLGYYFDVAHVS